MLTRLTRVEWESIKGAAAPRGRPATLGPVCVQGRDGGGGPGSDGDSLVLRAGTDGNAACGHSHLAGKGAEDKSRALRPLAS